MPKLKLWNCLVMISLVWSYRWIEVQVLNFSINNCNFKFYQFHKFFYSNICHREIDNHLNIVAFRLSTISFYQLHVMNRFVFLPLIGQVLIIWKVEKFLIQYLCKIYLIFIFFRYRPKKLAITIQWKIAIIFQKFKFLNRDISALKLYILWNFNCILNFHFHSTRSTL